VPAGQTVGVPTQTERSTATRGRILEAARALFAERGWAATSVDEVVRAAGVTKGALYHHFRDKTDLLRAVYEAQEQASIEHLLDRVDPTGDPLEALRAGSRAFLSECLDPTFRRIALVEAPAGLGWEEWREIDARYGFGLLRAGVEAAMDAGRLRRLPVDQIAHLLLAALSEAALLLGQSPDPEVDFDAIAGAFDALLDGLEVTAAS
jgi:AcrR family transcriptional regulator